MVYSIFMSLRFSPIIYFGEKIFKNFTKKLIFKKKTIRFHVFVTMLPLSNGEIYYEMSRINLIFISFKTFLLINLNKHYLKLLLNFQKYVFIRQLKSNIHVYKCDKSLILN